MDPVNWWWTPFNKLNGEEVALSRAPPEHAKNTKQRENSQKTMSIFRFFFQVLEVPVIPNHSFGRPWYGYIAAASLEGFTELYGVSYRIQNPEASP